MSKLKNPRAKKEASLAHDHRQASGENSKAARKSIPRAKARMQRAHRRAVHQALGNPEPLAAEELDVQRAENKLTRAARVRQGKSVKKAPDVPLREHLESKGRTRRR